MRSWLADPMRGRRPRARHHPDHRLGHELLLPRRARGADQPGHGLEPRASCSSASPSRSSPWASSRARVGRAIDRHGGRVGHDARHRARVRRACSRWPTSTARRRTWRCWAFLGARHAAVPVRRGVRRARAGRPPRAGRTAISYLTLFGAFASSVFWVVGHALNERVGWRQTLVLVRPHQPGGVPAAALVRPRPARGRRRARPATGGAPPACRPTGRRSRGARARSPSCSLPSSCRSTGSCSASSRSSSSRSLEAAGLATAAAVWVASLKGVAQFGGRVVEILFARNLRAITVAPHRRRRPAAVAAPAADAAPAACRWSLAFTLLMGASQGVITIVRGAVPLVLFGARGYGAVLGILATPVLIVQRRRAHRVRRDRGPLGLAGRERPRSW